jgi:GT2 family glycosyltransferase
LAVNKKEPKLRPAQYSEDPTMLSDQPSLRRAQSTIWACVAVFNRIQYTRRCLELLLAQTYPKLRTIVVDDGSSDGTYDMARAEHPEVVLLRADGSLYWTGAMRLGIEYILDHSAADDYVLLLNDDLVFAPNLVEDLLKTVRRHPQSLVQAVESCLDDPDLIWQGGAEIRWWTAKHRLLNYHRRISEFPPGYCQHSAYLTGRAVLVSVEVFRSVGNFDPRYQQNGDPEFTRRAARAGYELLVAYDVPVLSYKKGDNLNEAELYTLSDLKQYYFSVLSATRLSTRWRDAKLMTNSRMQALVFAAFSFIRITGHFLKRLRIRRRD